MGPGAVKPLLVPVQGCPIAWTLRVAIVIRVILHASVGVLIVLLDNRVPAILLFVIFLFILLASLSLTDVDVVIVIVIALITNLFSPPKSSSCITSSALGAGTTPPFPGAGTWSPAPPALGP